MRTSTFAIVLAMAIPARAYADDESEAGNATEEPEEAKPDDEPRAKPSAKVVAPQAVTARGRRGRDDRPKRLTVAAELLGATPVDAGNRDLFGAGGGASLGTDIYINRWLGVHAGMTFLGLAAGDGMESTTWLAAHAGPRVHLGDAVLGDGTPHDLWVDAHASYGTSGGIRRPGFDAGAALQWEVSPAIRIGPEVRYYFGSDPRDSHAHVLTVGLALGFGGRSRIPVRVEGDRDGDGIADGGDTCPDEAAGESPDPKRAGCPTDDRDGDGIVDAADQCRTEPAGKRPDPSREGCPFVDTDGDEIADLYDKCPNEAGPANSFEPSKHGCGELARVSGNKIEILQQVFFETDSAAIKEESFAVLQAVAKILTGLPNARVRIEGHTDDVGTDQYNLELSKRRARAVATWLIQSGGVDAGRLETEGYGKSRPIVKTTGADNNLNRRVEFVILEK